MAKDEPRWDPVLSEPAASAGNVACLLSTAMEKCFRADETITLLKGLNMPNGVGFPQRIPVVSAEVNRILRFDRASRHT